MSKLCVFIGEGLSERYFLPSLLEHQLGFSSLETKNAHLFQKNKGELFWHFPFPPGISCPEGGKDRLRKTETYRTAGGIVQNELYILGSEVEIHYRVITDHIFTDEAGQKRRSQEIEDAISSSGISFVSCKALIVENEMECWYLAGTTENALHVDTKKRADARLLLAQEPERVSDPKERINSILIPDVQGAIKKANIIGRHFDISKARQVSKSFDRFFSGLVEDGLI